jgi:hypothetical protein
MSQLYYWHTFPVSVGWAGGLEILGLVAVEELHSFLATARIFEHSLDAHGDVLEEVRGYELDFRYLLLNLMMDIWDVV